MSLRRTTLPCGTEIVAFANYVTQDDYERIRALLTNMEERVYAVRYVDRSDDLHLLHLAAQTIEFLLQ